MKFKLIEEVDIYKKISGIGEADGGIGLVGEELLDEDTVKVKDHKWTNKGKDGTHGYFKTKKEADAQRKAMYARGFSK